MDLALVGQILTIITVLFGLGVSIRNAFKIQVLHLSLNSRLDTLLAAVAATNRAEGRAEGIAAERATAVDLLAKGAEGMR